MSKKLPQAVQRTLDRGLADAAVAGIQNLPGSEASATAVQTAQQAPDPQTSSVSEPAPTGGQGPAEPPAPAGDNVTPIDWEQRYKAMKGRYDAEIPRMKEQLAEATVTIQQLQQSLSQTQPSQPPAGEAPPAETAPERWYGAEDLENFGQDFFDLVDKRVGPIEQRFQTEMKKLVEENNQLRSQLTQLGQGVQKIEKQPLLSALDQKMPNWRQLNRDPEFLDWARGTMVSRLDPRPMLDALRDSFAQGRVDIVAEIFQAYPGAQGDGQPAAAAPPSSHHAPVPGSQPPVQPPQVPATTVQPAMTLQSLSGPGTPQESGADVLQPAMGRVWTDALINQFYDGIRRGEISQQDAQRLEADLQQAISPEGRRAGRYRPK